MDCSALACAAGGWEVLSTQAQISLPAQAALHTPRRLISRYSLAGVSCLSESQAQVGATEGRSPERHTPRKPCFLASVFFISLHVSKAKKKKIRATLPLNKAERVAAWLRQFKKKKELFPAVQFGSTRKRKGSS